MTPIEIILAMLLALFVLVNLGQWIWLYAVALDLRQTIAAHKNRIGRILDDKVDVLRNFNRVGQKLTSLQQACVKFGYGRINDNAQFELIIVSNVSTASTPLTNVSPTPFFVSKPEN